jgi:hypothetical protein
MAAKHFSIDATSNLHVTAGARYVQRKLARVIDHFAVL